MAYRVPVFLLGWGSGGLLIPTPGVGCIFSIYPTTCTVRSCGPILELHENWVKEG